MEQKNSGPHLLKTLPGFYGTRRFVTAYKAARYLSLSWARSIQFMTPQFQFLMIHINIILPSTTGSSKWSPSFRFFPIKTMCILLLSTYVLHEPPISFFSVWALYYYYYYYYYYYTFPPHKQDNREYTSWRNPSSLLRTSWTTMDREILTEDWVEIRTFAYLNSLRSDLPLTTAKCVLPFQQTNSPLCCPVKVTSHTPRAYCKPHQINSYFHNIFVL